MCTEILCPTFLWCNRLVPFLVQQMYLSWILLPSLHFLQIRVAELKQREREKEMIMKRDTNNGISKHNEIQCMHKDFTLLC
mmetsp:Transcript_9936/g.14059  ORF Transcript_9936/g.14059 Transcript_9936/m.14059 type:complete len:81 (-) Transcript_9936:111-353(-)